MRTVGGCARTAAAASSRHTTVEAQNVIRRMDDLRGGASTHTTAGKGDVDGDTPTASQMLHPGEEGVQLFLACAL